MAERMTRREDGQTLIWAGIALAVALVLMVGVALETGHLYQERRRMQNAADAGALAGARQLCLGTPAPQAEAVARKYATELNGNATGRATAIGSAAALTMSVTAVESATLIFSGLLGSTSPVGASAQARCEVPPSGCTTWPLTIKMSQWDDEVHSGDTVYITVAEDSAFDNCPNECDCSHIFSGATTPQRGWFVRPSDNCGNAGGAAALKDAVYNGGYSDWTINVGDCIRGKPGASVGVFGGNNGKDLIDWVDSNPAKKQTVVLPLFKSYDTGDCGGGDGTCKSYTVGGFACLDIQPQWIKKDESVPTKAGSKKACTMTFSKAVVATVNGNCTVACGKGGTPPGEKDVTVPVLVH